MTRSSYSRVRRINLLLNLTTGEANATVRRCQGLGWLAWKRLTSSLNPRTLASGIKAISTKADHEVDSHVVSASSVAGHHRTTVDELAVATFGVEEEMRHEHEVLCCGADA